MCATTHTPAVSPAHVALVRGTVPSEPDTPSGPDGRRRPARQARADRPRDDRPQRDTRFRPGNRAWTARRSTGRRRRFADAEALRTACCAYFAWADAHPLIHVEPVVWRGKVTMRLEVPKLRPYTIEAMCLHLSIGRTTWHDYRRRPDFSEVCG